MDRTPFGSIDGREVLRYDLDNGTISCSVLDYGCTLQSLNVPDRNGRMVDVVLGYDSLEQYATLSGRLGATIGRFANRIANGRLPIDGKVYQLSINRSPHHIHGGFRGFDKRVWDVIEADADHVTMRLLSVDGEEGYPGNLEATATYRLEGSSLVLEHRAFSDRDTVCSLTNHSYFNLSDGGTVDTHIVSVDARRHLTADDKGIPTGEREAEGEMDLRMPKALSSSYDCCYLLDSQEDCATCCSDDTGIRMTVSTDMPAMQLYTGDGLKTIVGKNGRTIGRRSGVCFETQFPPDAPNSRFAETCILRKGERYEHRTRFGFDIERRR
ncbi:MAG: galactose mutarotase [Thermoplasmata archaeon]|jgi:aldose 1-epimerase|nr:galactose mutarotase [Thermoplasmata archaeon]